MTGLIVLFLTAFVLIALLGALAIVWQIVRPGRKTYATALAKGLPTEPADADLTGQPATFNLPGNHTTPGWIITGHDPDAPTLLILHGHRDSRHGALLRAQLLAPYASHLIVFDWPAHGECTAPWMTCGKREADDANAVLQGLPDAIRNKPVVLFGYSLGGQIAVKTAAEHPHFAGVILDGAYRRWDTPVRLHLKKHRVPPWPFMPIAGVVFRAFGLIQNFDRAQYAKQIAVPLLVLHGTDDRICPVHEGQELADHAPDSTFVSIEAGQHNRLHEYDPEAYHAALDTFFKAIASAPRPPSKPTE